MPSDVLSSRAKFGVMGPSTNTIVQPEFDDMRPWGVTNHYSRILNSNAAAISNETFLAGTMEIWGLTLDAVRWVMNADPDYLIMGMSAVTFNDGVEGADRFAASVKEASGGLNVSIGSHSTRDALNAYGGIKRIAVISPYYPAMNDILRTYYAECGFEVVRDIALECENWLAIAKVTGPRLIEELKKLDGDDIDAIVQVGTNLCMAELAGEAERWLGKPVIAINTATYWHALRANGIDDKVPGFGRLMMDF
ncbi:MAG: maleate isomerase [Halieaceae bacterium]|jgi:maleate isomerase